MTDTPKIPHTVPWPPVTRTEQKLLQPLTDVVNGDTPVGEPKRVLDVCLATHNKPGSANQAALRVALRQIAEPLKPEWIKDSQSYFTTQEKFGFMCPWDRKEFGEEGGHGQFHIAAVTAMLQTGMLDALCLAWIRSWMVLHEKAEYKGVYYLPMTRASTKWAPTSAPTMSLLQTGKWNPKAKEWGWKTDAGYPQMIGAWYLRRLYECHFLTAPIAYADKDLPPTPFPVHFVRTTAGICNWIVGVQVIPANMPVQAVAGAWGSNQFFYRRNPGEPYNGPGGVWPTEQSPGFPLEGKITEHWRGDLKGWERID